MTVDPMKPANLGPRALALWDELVKPGALVGAKVVIAEACRLADRLDTYDAMLTADPLAAGVSSEARLAAAALQRLLAGLTQSPSAGESPEETKPLGTLADEIASRRASRQANAAG